MTRARVIITDRGAGAERGRAAYGQDIGVFVVSADGTETLIPGLISLVIRCDGRRSVATLEIDVDRVELSRLNLTVAMPITDTGG